MNFQYSTLSFRHDCVYMSFKYSREYSEIRRAKRRGEWKENEDGRIVGVSSIAGGPQIWYHGGPLGKSFRRHRASEPERTRAQKGMTVKYDARYTPQHCLRHENRTLSRREVVGQGDKGTKGDERGRMCESRMAPLMIPEHLDRLKEDFHCWTMTTALSSSVLSARGLILLLISPKLPFERGPPVVKRH